MDSVVTGVFQPDGLDMKKHCKRCGCMEKHGSTGSSRFCCNACKHHRGNGAIRHTRNCTGFVHKVESMGDVEKCVEIVDDPAEERQILKNVKSVMDILCYCVREFQANGGGQCRHEFRPAAFRAPNTQGGIDWTIEHSLIFWRWPPQDYEKWTLSDRQLNVHSKHTNMKCDKKVILIATSVEFHHAIPWNDNYTLQLQHRFRNKRNYNCRDTGCTGATMWDIWQHEDFQDCMEEAVTKIEDNHLSLFFIFCDHGTHRSLAMACLLHCLCYAKAVIMCTTMRTLKDARKVGWEILAEKSQRRAALEEPALEEPAKRRRREV